MVTKGIIKSIDLLGNTCTVHIPFFETAGNDPIIETATVSNTPGSYNGYKVGDAVYVAFEDGNMSTPVVIGKLYLGTEKEKADPRGVSNVEESTATKKATLPADSKLTAEIDSTVPNTTVPYSSLSSIANGLNKLNTDVGQMDRDYGNRFKQVISNAEGLKSEIEQTAENVVAKVSGYETDIAGNPILTKPTEFGWNLQKDSWSVFSQDGPILTADKDGLHVAGIIDAESGHIADFLIKDKGIVSYTTSTDEDGKKTETPWITNFTNDGQELSSSDGVYVGTDGIKLGKNFSVDESGDVVASSLKISSGQKIEEALGEVATNAQTNLENALKDPATAGDTTLGSTWLSTTSVYAQNLHVANADITNQILVGSKDSPILYANVNDSENVKIGGFKVSSTQIRNGNDLILSTTDLSSNQTVASHSSKDWRLTIGTKFGVKDDGVLYAQGAKFKDGIVPTTSGDGSVGTSSLRWGNIYGANIDAQGTLVSKNAQDKVLFGTDMNGNTVLNGQLHAHGQIVTDAQVFSSGAIISYNPTTDTTTNGNTVTVNPRILLNPDGDGQIRCRGGVYVYADDESITGKLDADDPMHTTGTGPWPMFAVDNKGEVWAKKVHFSQGGSIFYEPVISVADGNSNSVYTTMIDIATDVTGGSVIYAQWKSIRLPGAFQMTNPHATNDKVKGVFLTGFLSDSHVDTSTTVSGSCGSTSTETGTVLNIGAQGLTHYVRWDATHVYVLIPKTITIDSSITSTFDIKLCLLIVGAIAKQNN